MRLTRLISLASFALIPSIALTACGGGDDGGEPVLLDAAVPDAVPPPPDAEPCPQDECDGVCTNFDNNEQTCGNCTTVCNGGEACNGGACACVAAYVPATPNLLGSQLTDMIPGATSGFGIFLIGGSTPGLLGVGYATEGTVIGMEYTLVPPPQDGIPAPPFIAAGYNVDLQAFEADTAHFATAGTLVFDSICEDDAGMPTGFTGHATGVTFSPVAGITNPTIDKDGCEPFTVETLTFAFGAACPIPPQK